MPASPQGSQKLPGRSRIKESREYARIKSHGRRFGTGSLLVNWMLEPSCSRSRVGIIVSRKVGNAVTRNLAKRRLREVFRKHQSQLLPSLQLVIVARPSIARKSFWEVEQDFLQAVKTAQIRSAPSAS
ncbi:MAG: ribonuclease P protein component [Verrucomicrobia bacterium]|nr:ribonuclease P protein component [Verrucomicrobiota bacterium]